MGHGDLEVRHQTSAESEVREDTQESSIQNGSRMASSIDERRSSKHLDPDTTLAGAVTADEHVSPQAPLWRRILSFILEQWFMVAYVMIIVISYLAPSVAKRGGHLHSEYTFAYGGLCIVFLVAGYTMPTDILWQQARQIKAHVITQSMCFIITPLLGFAIVQIIVAADPSEARIPRLVLAGIVIMICTPTTIASNITFTRNAHGNDATCLVEVVIGNMCGILISPALLQLFLRDSLGLGIGRPRQPVGKIYSALFEHFGPCLYGALAVGQLLRNINVDFAKRLSRKLYLPKWATIALLCFLWSSFSNSFASGAYDVLPTTSIILVVFLGFALYPLYTLICFYLCRFPGAPPWFRLDKGQTTAACFCGPPKSMPVGVVLIAVQYSNFSPLEQGILTIPLTLYQGMQIFVAQFFVVVFRRWNDKKEIADGESTPGSSAVMQPAAPTKHDSPPSTDR